MCQTKWDMQIYRGQFSSESSCNFGRATAIILSLFRVSFSPRHDNLLPVFLHYSPRHRHCVILLIKNFKALTHFVALVISFFGIKKPKNMFTSWVKKKKKRLPHIDLIQRLIFIAYWTMELAILSFPFLYSCVWLSKTLLLTVQRFSFNLFLSLFKSRNIFT